MVNWLTLAVPFAYLGVLLGSLATFSSLYRKRKAQKSLSLSPWFPPHTQRDIYFSLLHLDPKDNPNEKGKKVPDSVLKSALLRRAIEDIKRVMALRNQKQALAMLLQRGSVGDDLWQRFVRAEKEMEEEVRDVVAEANAYVPGWGQTIFQSANEMLNNAIYRERMEKHQAKLEEEKQWWDKKKEGFMKELDPESASASTAEGKKVEASASGSESGSGEATPATKTPESSGAPPSVAGSDDDAVLVEKDEQAAAAGGNKGGN
ncbi:pre protein translocase subunit Sec66 [Aspergillus sclerotiicarbonarius CBS 121057]|uniref:Pre protein translocase subunit Sec66 n=1 Tax=Aspergillus sclerotiicarbonarius (strain CBS 121057 / IBT 28362) TaxID=1448318 RepID=A0A319E831_ASPSB|nr:pre protein translocase subunit Sec66 [Aspergillus sclerotiicarbonarius CBS 121057]